MATIANSINPTTVQNLENMMNATARSIRKVNAAATKAAATKVTMEAAAAAAVETVTKPKPVRKPKAKVTVTVSPANLEKLAAVALTVAHNRLNESNAITDPKRGPLAWAKADAAIEIARLRATEAGLPDPFPQPTDKEIAHNEEHAAGDDGPDNVGPTEDDVPEEMDVRVKRPSAAAVRKAAKIAADEAAAEAAREETEADLAKEPTDAEIAEFGEFYDTPKLTDRQAALMAAIGNQRFSFFDGGIVADEGIWHAQLTDEAAGPDSDIATTPHGVANVIAALGRKGLLNSSGEQGDGDDGVWVSLTASGAALARLLADPTSAPTRVRKGATAKAKVTKAAKVTPAPVKPVAKPVTKAAAAKAAKAAAEADPSKNSKVLSLAAHAATMGWTVEVGSTPPSVVVVSERDAEKLTVWFIDGKMDLLNKPTYLRADGSVVLLRNVSAVKMQMDSDPAARPVKAVRSVAKRASKPVEGAETPQRSLSFDPAETCDDEIAEIIAGSLLRWRRTDGTVDEAVAGKKVTVTAHPRKPANVNRVIHFWSMVPSEKRGMIAGPERHVGLDLLLSVGK